MEVGGRLSLSWQYSADIFDGGTIERWSRGFARMLASIATDPGQPIHALEVLPDGEHEQVGAWSRGEVQARPRATLHGLFEAQAPRAPDAVAVEHDGERLCYGALNAQANQLARYLVSQGAGPGVRIGVLAERSVEMVVGLLGILKSGGAYVPLDPSYPGSRLLYLLEDSGCELVVAQQHLVTTLPQGSRKVFPLDAEVRAALLRGQSEADLVREVGEADAAYVIYTSGSTGQPKGVVVGHGAAANYVQHAAEAYGRGVVGSVVSLSLSFDA